MTPNTVKQPSDEITRARQRKARVQLRKVDLVLKQEGIEAAMKALVQVRLKIPINVVIRSWLRDYQDMLMAWHADLMPEVVSEFKTYGFRRARNTVCQLMGQTSHERMLSLFMACERVLEQMSERSVRSISDVESERPEVHPQMVSLEEVSEEELERGTKY